MAHSPLTSGSPYQAGVKPSALATDPTSRFVFVTDYASNELIGYTVLSTNVLSFMINGPFKTGNEPTSITIDPRGIYMYVTNSLDNTLVVLFHRPAHRHAFHHRGLWLDSRKHHRYRPGVSQPSSPRWAASSTPPTTWATPSPASSSIPTPAL